MQEIIMLHTQDLSIDFVSRLKMGTKMKMLDTDNSCIVNLSALRNFYP